VNEHHNCRCYFPIIPGSLTMRWPQYVSRFFAYGRQLDGKPATEYTVSRSEDAKKWPIKYIGGKN
jgi:hypothetical protein